ncbi:MAG: hypothetical protein KGQ86_08450 [Bacteroidetes bacterium]|nr:hypothetical protein [Bacteroidota bacterium]
MAQMAENMIKVQLLVFGLLFLGSLRLDGQSTPSIIPKYNSPYSRLGIGNYYPGYFSAAAGMGGIGVGYNDPTHLNPQNPASLGFLRVTAFEGGLFSRFSNLNNGKGENDAAWSGNIQYVSLGFPMKNPINESLERQQPNSGYGMAFTLLPYTYVGYDVKSTIENPGFGTATNSLKGTGGTYKLAWSNGIRFKNIALGLETAYLFGKITNSRRLQLDSSSIAYGTELADEISLRGLRLKGGFQAAIDFGKKKDKDKYVSDYKRLLISGTYTLGGSVQSNASRFYRRELTLTTTIVDTLIREFNDIQNGTLPVEFGFGLTFERFNKLRLSAEYTVGKWSQYQLEAKSDQLFDNYFFRFGGELIPEYASYNKYSRRMSYRLGAFYGTDPRTVNGKSLLQYGLTMGLGLPIVVPRQTPSFVDLSLEIGRFGLKDALRETYIQVTAGFSLNDNTWFYKRKFN